MDVTLPAELRAQVDQELASSQLSEPRRPARTGIRHFLDHRQPCQRRLAALRRSVHGSSSEMVLGDYSGRTLELNLGWPNSLTTHLEMRNCMGMARPHRRNPGPLPPESVEQFTGIRNSTPPRSRFRVVD